MMNYKMVDGEKVYSYRWVMLALMCLACIVVNGSTLIFAGMAGTLLAPPEAGGLGFDSQQFAFLMSCSYLTGFLFCLVTGTWADRSGIRKVLIIGFAISAIGAVVRIFGSDSFLIMAVTSVVFGFGLASLNANSAKILRVWFPGNMVGVAMGFYLAAATVGCALAVPLAGAAPSISMCFTAVAVLSVVNVIAWIAFAKPHPDGEQPVVEPVMQHLGVVMKSKNLWVACLVIGFVMAAGAVNNGYLVAALNAAKGVDYTSATLVSSVCNLTCSVGGLLVPSICAKIHNEKKILIGLGAAIVVCIAIYWFALDGMATAVGIALVSVLVGGTLPLAKSLPAQLPDISKEHMGAAGGLHSTVQNAFAFLIPTFVVAPLCGLNYDLLNGASYMILMALMTISACFLPKLVTGGEAASAKEE